MNIKKNLAVASSYEQLPADQRVAFDQEFNSRRKRLFTAYLLFFLIAGHYLYLGRIGMQLLFWLTGGFFIVGVIVDLFRMPGLVRRYNEDLQKKLMIEHKLLAAPLAVQG